MVLLFYEGVANFVFFSYFCSDEHCLENKDFLKHENSKNISIYRLSFDCVVRH